MRELGWAECRVSVPAEPISDEQYRKLVLLDNHNNGLWDIDELANGWDMEMLHDIGLHDIMNIPTQEQNEQNAQSKPKAMVCCPNCKEVFPVKGNKAE